MNGDFVPWAESTVPLSTHALHYGTGVFEGIRSYAVNGEAAIFRLAAHLDRFYASSAVYGMRIPFSRQQLTEAICGLLRRGGDAGHSRAMFDRDRNSCLAADGSRQRAEPEERRSVDCLSVSEV